MTWGELRSGKDRVLSNADKASPEQAIAELLWNSFDANATEIRVTVESSELGGAAKLIVEDNGDGIPHDEARDLFLTEGDSWKKDARFSPGLRRPMHGKLGRGRLLGYSVAETVTWRTTFRSDDAQQSSSYSIVGSRDKPAGFEIGEQTSVSAAPGTTVTLRLRDNQKAARIADDSFRRRLLGQIAESLSTIGCVVTWNGEQLDPDDVIDTRTPLELPPFEPSVLRGHPSPSLVFIEWTEAVGTQKVQLCNEGGATLTDTKPSTPPPAPFSWTAYLKWEGFGDPNLMGIADLHAPEFQHSELLTAVDEVVGAHVMRRLNEQKGHIVREWINEGVYPFTGRPADRAQEIERDLFDVVAVIASPSIPKRGADQKRLALRLLREALRAEPGRLRSALDAVMDLEERDLESLERLLQRTELGAIVRSAAKVTDRLDFLEGLALLLHSDDTKSVFREVDQLHPILVNEPWVFGDEWTECLSEHGLTRVVRSVVAAKNQDAVVAVEPVTLPDGKRGRVDLLFHKVVPESEQQRHLVVELKRPGTLTMDHYGQVAGYATAITGHPEVANTATKWDFWLIGTDLDQTLSNERDGADRRPGFVKDYGTHRLWVITWGELIDSLRRKFENYRSGLAIEPESTSGIDYLQRTHDSYIPEELRQENGSPAESDS